MKRALSIILAFILLISCFSISCFAEEKLSYVVIGDSIARGAGVLNPDEACYGLMVANTNGYDYANYGVDGLTSEGLLRRLDEEEVSKSIKEADIISISIGGNDFLMSNIINLFISAEITHDYDEFYSIRDKFYENFDKIIKKIKSENPDVLILMQTLYNMRHDLLKGTNQLGTDLLNECYNRYLEENPGAYILVDAGTELSQRRDCLALDTIHPNGTGNEVIARHILEALKEQGLGTATEPVIKIEPIEQFEFGIEHIIRVIKYYVNYVKTH